jgi:hypothetical protein
MRKYGLITYLVLTLDGMGRKGKEVGVRYIPLRKLNLSSFISHKYHFL